MITTCEDGSDNDGDGWVDDDDPDCLIGSEETAATTGFACNDGEDNDGDGDIDADDADCENGYDEDESE